VASLTQQQLWIALAANGSMSSITPVTDHNITLATPSISDRLSFSADYLYAVCSNPYDITSRPIIKARLTVAYQVPGTYSNSIRKCMLLLWFLL
jgi:hypothetical protein